MREEENMEKLRDLSGVTGVTQDTVESEIAQAQVKMPELLTLWRMMAQGCVALTIIGVWLLVIILEIKVDLLAASLIYGPLFSGFIGAWIYAGKRFSAYESTFFPGEGMRVRSGVLWRKEKWLPIARLQHLDVNQGPLGRKWGMAGLALHTAGTHDHELVLYGLPTADAHKLREILMPRRPVNHD
jgi:membrane protein YdbS with pleckstrin-like domain